MRLEAVDVGIVEDFDGRLFDGPVHPFSLTIGPGVIWFGQLVCNPVLGADAVEDVRPEISPGWPVSVLGQVGELDTVVR